MTVKLTLMKSFIEIMISILNQTISNDFETLHHCLRISPKYPIFLLLFTDAIFGLRRHHHASLVATCRISNLQIEIIVLDFIIQ